MKRQIVLATRNADKLREIRNILPEFEFLTLKQFPDTPQVDETEETLDGNAVKKARETAVHTGKTCLADDSGLEVEALGGLPGVRSARFAGENASYEDNNRKLLGLLEGEENRKARFRCVIAVCRPEGETFTREGICEGTIADLSRGNEGFGYDPVFMPKGTDKTFAELKPEEKNSMSHRAEALRKIRDLLRKIF